MKTLILGSLALAGMLLAGLQHQQMGRLRAENGTLQQASAEADRLKADLAKSTNDETQDAEEMERLREANHDLLKLRNEVNQLRDAKSVFEKVSAENKRLAAQAKNVPGPDTATATMQPIVVRMADLYDHGLATPEATVQTFYWAQRDGNREALARCMKPIDQQIYNNLNQVWFQRSIKRILSFEIVARREVDKTTVQLGVQTHYVDNPQDGRKLAITLVFQDYEWRVKNTAN
jgi:hypothetical protein